ncbi:MAG: type VI secretion system tip protein VgrG [Desulfobacteraceae bacterium]|nr:type VI secretion system tip protein VgrG [Desulfobacteraceae bacterium]MBC2719683.1 type VI secretion system tip protein VgrG [Desulfobacteraceae bacterium]
MTLFGSAGEVRFLFQIAEIDLRVVDFTAAETISSPYNVDLTLASEDEIDFNDMIGKKALLIIIGDEENRYFHGVINKFTQGGNRGRFYLYAATMVPFVCFLSFMQDLRIFQNKKVPDIVEQILKDGGITTDCFEFRLQGQYQEREYCVQYRETNLDFISRLLEEEGIFYFFEHTHDNYLMVFGDGMVNYQPIAGKADIVFHLPDAMVAEKEYVHRFNLSQQIRSGKVTLRDFNFKKPSLDLTSQKEADSFQKLEVYDYPGEYSDEGTGKNLSLVRLQEAVVFKDQAEGQSLCSCFIPCFTFNMTGHERDDFNQEYLLVDVNHTGSQPQVLEEQAGSDLEFSYSNGFLVIPSSVNFRPLRKTAKPVVEGVQTAIVVGPSSEEIYTDEYGRVKVQFHWDREGKKDEKSSCWIRVSSDFAGAEHGCIFTPRIGQEVIVRFLEGDPDQPIITGRVYNAATMPPYTLPDKKTKSAIKTNSSFGGDGFNEIRFEDAKGDEEIFVHAEKEMNIRVKNNRREWIGNDRHLFVYLDEQDGGDSGNKFELVERDKHVIVRRDSIEEIQGDSHLNIKGKKAVEVTGSHSVTVHDDMIEVFDKNHSMEVAQDYYTKGMNVVIEAKTGLTINVGGNFITIDSSGVTISGSSVNFNEGGSALSGSAGSSVAPLAPLEAEAAGSASPGMDPKEEAAQNAPWHQEHPKPEKFTIKDGQAAPEKKSWIEIELVDEDDQPIAGERYRITLPDGTTIAQGTTGSDGVARVSGIDPGTCKVTFPDLDESLFQ